MATALETLPHFEAVVEELENGERYEIIDGVRVEMPPMSVNSSGVANDLVFSLSTYGIANNIGKAYTEILFHLPLPIDRNRRPDVAFVPFACWPRALERPNTNTWDVLPALCVEVVSPSDLAEEVMEKVEEYFQAGVRLVWVVYPRHHRVFVYESPSSVRALTRTDTLDGGLILPGFQLPLAELFPAQS